jgi:hypothetical protein
VHSGLDLKHCSAKIKLVQKSICCQGSASEFKSTHPAGCASTHPTNAHLIPHGGSTPQSPQANCTMPALARSSSAGNRSRHTGLCHFAFCRSCPSLIHHTKSNCCIISPAPKSRPSVVMAYFQITWRSNHIYIIRPFIGIITDLTAITPMMHDASNCCLGQPVNHNLVTSQPVCTVTAVGDCSHCTNRL